MSDWNLTERDLKRYPHFDQLIGVEKAKALAMDPTRVAQHSFFPLLMYAKARKPFRKKVDGKKPPPKPPRPIRYAARRDAYIFGYYRHLLSERYEAELAALGISHCPIAYRRIPIAPGDKRGKSNIQFANEAISRIRSHEACCALAVDISSYFESIDHEKLKALWCRLLKVDRLPDDHFAVFKNITRYRVVDRTEAYRRLGHFGVKRYVGVRPIEGYLTPFKDIPKQLCTPAMFREKIAGQGAGYDSIITTNPDTFGIPQGAPISDLLANLFLIDFDVEMDALARSFGGSYIRYSDDILLILPVAVDEARNLMSSLPNMIRRHGEKLVIAPSKSSLVRYEKVGDHQSFTLVDGKGANGLEYLGFRYDGKDVYLRNSTVANLYRSVAKAAASQALATFKRYPDKSYDELCEMFDFEQFSKRFGRVEDFASASEFRQWTFWTYVKRSVEEFGDLGNRIHGQVARLRRRSKKRVEQQLAKLVEKRDRQNVDEVFDGISE